PVDLGDAAHGAQDRPARLQNAMQRRDRPVDVVDEGEGLGQDDTVEPVRGNLLRGGQVRYDRCTGMARVDVENVARDDPVTPELAGVAVITDLQHPAPDVGGVGREKPLDV